MHIVIFGGMKKRMKSFPNILSQGIIPIIRIGNWSTFTSI